MRLKAAHGGALRRQDFPPFFRWFCPKSWEIELKKWVSDKLMLLLGYSMPEIVLYVLGLSEQALSPAELAQQLEDVGLSASSETRSFAEEIFKKVPRDKASSGLNLYQIQER
ncbi:unnamed protein product [Camellia sinensis]